MTDVRGSRVVQLISDPQVREPMRIFAVSIAALTAEGASVDLTWLAHSLWPANGIRLVRDLVDADMSGDRLLCRYFPEFAWHRLWREMAGRPALSVINGGAA